MPCLWHPGIFFLRCSLFKCFCGRMRLKFEWKGDERKTQSAAAVVVVALLLLRVRFCACYCAASDSLQRFKKRGSKNSSLSLFLLENKKEASNNSTLAKNKCQFPGLVFSLFPPGFFGWCKNVIIKAPFEFRCKKEMISFIRFRSFGPRKLGKMAWKMVNKFEFRSN